MVRIDYKKTCDKVLQSCLRDYLRMYKISNKVIKFITETIKKWKVKLTAGGTSSAGVKILSGIFQGYAPSPLLFVIAMKPLYNIHRKFTGGYRFAKLQGRINYLMYMDNIKLFTKYEKELEILIQTVRIYSQDIVVEFHIKKLLIIRMKKKTTNNWRNRTTKSRKG